MPNLDPSDQEDCNHLIQLFYAAHVDYGKQNERMRAKTGLTGEYFVSMKAMVEMAQWARTNRMITEQAASDMASFAKDFDQQARQNLGKI
jgi:hypothetical protein